jgi:GIY-YIG catalytic domain
MSNPDIDYSNTIIYKIMCKDPNIPDVYVGHTVNFVQRKKAHQLCCMNSNSRGHNCKVYRVIRNNGGWNNWSMDIIAFYKCKDLNEARQKEQEHFVALNATLNSVEPFPSKHVKRVKNVKRVKRVNRIIRVNPARLNTSTYNQNIPNSNRQNKLHNCEPCNFVTTCKRDYERHILTQKHIDGGRSAVTPIKTSDGYSCPCCKKVFKSRTSVYKHTPLCKTVVTSSPPPAPPAPPAPSTSIPSGTTEPQISDDMAKNIMNMMMMLFKQNYELHNKVMEMCKNGGTSNSHNTTNTNTNTITNSNNNNNTFNMNLFLNEEM